MTQLQERPCVNRPPSNHNLYRMMETWTRGLLRPCCEMARSWWSEGLRAGGGEFLAKESEAMVVELKVRNVMIRGRFEGNHHVTSLGPKDSSSSKDRWASTAAGVDVVLGLVYRQLQKEVLDVVVRAAEPKEVALGRRTQRDAGYFVPFCLVEAEVPRT
ncbi:hypothetical protein B0H19DRAFT_1085682 [Mycena capillaripes]|nr:hypothetical protein B0H19DRAFT_1085682 [Mycena capillaripes]